MSEIAILGLKWIIIIALIFAAYCLGANRDRSALIKELRLLEENLEKYEGQAVRMVKLWIARQREMLGI